jgi:ferredoxin-NADP reductase
MRPEVDMEPRLEWQRGVVTDIKPETPSVKTLTLRLPAWMRHRAGQHYDVRLTADDGYQAQRSYSVASPPEREGVIELTVEQLEDGEVSPYLCDDVRPGDQLEVRGPIGGYFVWEASMSGPLLLVGGGSGVVPLMAMLRHRAAASSQPAGFMNMLRPDRGTQARVPARLLYSVRTPDEVIYRGELDRTAAADPDLQVVYTFTRATPLKWTGYMRRIDAQMLSEVSAGLGRDAKAYVCGPTLLVEAVADALVGLGWSPDAVRTERFGPTGGTI